MRTQFTQFCLRQIPAASEDEWKISLEIRHQKTGASSHYWEFKSMVRELVEHDHLPDYRVALEGEDVVFRNRMGERPKRTRLIRYSTRKPTTMRARCSRPRRVFSGARMARLVGGERDARVGLSWKGVRWFLKEAVFTQPESLISKSRSFFRK
jgi:hypothetical protein